MFIFKIFLKYAMSKIITNTEIDTQFVKQFYLFLYYFIYICICDNIFFMILPAHFFMQKNHENQGQQSEVLK